ncbi:MULTISPECIES: toxin HicA [Corynebacterium]|uniref:Toxin HicA n=1 Tax=Corynebacterium stationis TaxID=1705 RepID=A0AB36CNP2_9CORY|nr:MULTISPECIES: toxin HicA [Corynebacterium]NME90167.1 toxin HicA [Corynebacterium stationis]NWO17135.1 toxin HicA [Corynebacterium sp.]PQM73461.1 toxin HicA [Corynebacterium sp. J010B-136]WLP87813.1 toxin HicA [Corynebacterium stationis]
MANSIDDIIQKIRRGSKDIKFSELEKVCDHYFESRNTRKSSHKTYKTPWPGNPRVNIQNANGKAKWYQAVQVLQAIDKLTAENNKKEN